MSKGIYEKLMPSPEYYLSETIHLQVNDILVQGIKSLKVDYYVDILST